MTTKSCRKCGTDMAPGKALVQTFTRGSPDLGGEVMTFSAGGPGKLIDCWKCVACGHSITVEAP